MNRVQNIKRTQERKEESSRSSKRTAEEQLTKSTVKRRAHDSNAVTRGTEHISRGGFQSGGGRSASHREAGRSKRVTFENEVRVSTIGKYQTQIRPAKRVAFQEEAGPSTRGVYQNSAGEQSTTTSLKRKAEEQLTRNTVVVVQPVHITDQEPVQAPFQEHNLPRNTVFAFQRTITMFLSACFDLYASLRGLWARPTYTNITYENPTIVAEDHVQSSEVRIDGNTTLKRQKTRSPNAATSQSALGQVVYDKPRPDLSGVKDKEEQRRLMDEYYDAPSPAELMHGHKQKTQAFIIRPAIATRLPAPETLSIPEAASENATLPEPAATQNPSTLHNHQNSDRPRRHSDPAESATTTMSPTNLPGRYPASPAGESADISGFNAGGPRTQSSESRHYSRRRLQPSERALQLGQHPGGPELDQCMDELLIDNATDLTPSSRAQKIREMAAKERREKEREDYLRREKEKREKERRDAARRAKELRLHRITPLQSMIRPPYEGLDERYNLWKKSLSNPPGQMSTSKEGTALLGKDFYTLMGKDGHEWLNDEIVNAYLEWVVDAANKDAVAQGQALGEPASSVPKFIVHNSFFFPNLKKKGTDSTARLMKRLKAPGERLLEVDSVFIPICERNHWTLGVVRPVAKTIEYLDSFGGRKQEYFTLIREWLKHQLGDLYDANEWKEPETHCVRQTNGYDCGVFACTNALCVVLGFDTASSYKAEQMLQQRKNIAAVLNGRGFKEALEWRNWMYPKQKESLKEATPEKKQRMPCSFPSSV